MTGTVTWNFMWSTTLTVILYPPLTPNKISGHAPDYECSHSRAAAGLLCPVLPSVLSCPLWLQSTNQHTWQHFQTSATDRAHHLLYWFQLATVRPNSASMQYASIMAVLVTGPTVTQNSPFLLRPWLTPLSVHIAPNHRGMARLSGLDKYSDGRPAKGGHWSQYWLGST